MIILDELNPHFDNIITKKLKVNLYFNEYEKSKHEILKNTLTSEDEDLRPYSIEIENLDFKSEGFNLHKSKMTDPERLNRLIIICALAYLWLIGMGVAIFAKKSWINRVYKVQKDTLNLFTHGKRLYKYLIKNDLPTPNIFDALKFIKVSV